MTTINYPSTLPNALDGAFAESQLETKVADQGSVGAPRQRNRFTRALQRFSYSLILTSAQKAILDAFYASDLSRGVNSFNWTHPTTAVVYEAIFPARPASSHMTTDYWSVSVEVHEI